LAGSISLSSPSVTAAPNAPGGSWLPLNISGRSGQAVVIDPRRHRMIIFGGRSHLGSRSDLWELTLDSPTYWRRLEASGDSPPPMDRMSAVLDPDRNRVLVYAGRDSMGCGTCPSPTCRDYDGAWALNLNGTSRWSALSPAGPAPPARSGHVAIYDPLRDRMV